MIPRRIVRTLIQAALFFVLLFTLVFFADARYRLLPDRIHSALPSHHPGSVITDITVTFCSSANLFSSCRLDSDQWHRVEKDLYLRSGWVQSAWLHYQHKKEEELGADDRVVIGLKVSRNNPNSAEDREDPSEVWESRPGGIWILRSNRRHDSDSSRAITAVDVLFGPDSVEVRPNWELTPTPLLLSSGTQIVRLSTRHGHPPPLSTQYTQVKPRVSKEGRFKILQISDTHLATGLGVCRDALGEDELPSKNCEADTRTLEFLEKILDEEKPDLVVLSGDQTEGPAAPDTQSTIFKLAALMIERKIPYAAIFGNHDNEGDVSLSRAAQMSLLETLPYSLSSAGPDAVDGVGNYYVEILAHSSQHSAITLYMLDTHAGSPDEKHYIGYDWLKQSQIDWFKRTSQSLRKDHQKYAHIHLDLAFIHIPLPEYIEDSPIIAGGELREGVTAPKYNSHFYDALVEEGVVAVGCGHDHANDYCALRPLKEGGAAGDRQHLGPWMCYAGGSGFGGYGGYQGFHRGVRVWDFDATVGRIVTWKRLECCGEKKDRKIDELMIVEGGKVVAPSS
ncbi:Phosphatase DCR2 [Acrodontium crateriforme]|uniref:Phosphatase DCR2 n=1 Tax=Acrodontium crateriforme TaxID=150365 RepID=A0AAQ3M177_9PEZI|nr:Phosphatase DCR2 [Acrodontium crateriforme]